MNANSNNNARLSMATSQSAVKARQLAHLNSQLAQLSTNLANTQELMRVTMNQAEFLRGLGAWHGGMFMAASKVLGEESVKEPGNQSVEHEKAAPR